MTTSIDRFLNLRAQVSRRTSAADGEGGVTSALTVVAEALPCMLTDPVPPKRAEEHGQYVSQPQRVIYTQPDADVRAGDILVVAALGGLRVEVETITRHSWAAYRKGLVIEQEQG